MAETVHYIIYSLLFTQSIKAEMTSGHTTLLRVHFVWPGLTEYECEHMTLTGHARRRRRWVGIIA